MASEKHTPGPWQISRGRAGKNGTSLTIWRNDEGPNAGDDEGNTNWSWIAQHIHSEADARLIAASPDMLAALKEAVAVHGTPARFLPDEEEHSWCAVARAAIAKAEGGDA